MYIFCITDLLLSNRRCADLLFIELNPNTTKWAYTDTDSSTLTCTMTRRTIGGGGGYLLHKATSLEIISGQHSENAEVYHWNKEACARRM